MKDYSVSFGTLFSYAIFCSPAGIPPCDVEY